MRSSKSMIPGAASHMAFTGGWLARKSPPYTVSSKCCAVESPSPFKFLAALMPPCAHTECDRFTGTMENRSTDPPISAILITAANPASPPPTTMILGFAMLYLLFLTWVTISLGQAGLRVLNLTGPNRIHRLLLEAHPHRVKAAQTDAAHYHKEFQTGRQQPLLRFFPGNQPPLGGKQPHAIGQMPAR